MDGQVVAMAVWADRQVHDGMTIRTKSPAIDAALKTRLHHLHEHKQCQFIGQIQEFVAAKAGSRG